MIEEYIPIGHDNAITLREIGMRTGMSSRNIRRAIEEVNNSGKICILNNGDGKGYFLYGGREDEPYRQAYIRQEAARVRSITHKVRKMVMAKGAAI